MPLDALIYQSRALIPNDPAQHNAILQACNMRNQQDGVTGFLHREADWFLQYLEGPSAALDAAMARISADPRHTGVQVLYRDQIAERRFPEWQMGFVVDDQMALADLLDTGGDDLALQVDDPFDLVVFLSTNADLLRSRLAA